MFIKCMLYGIEKNKDGNKYSETERLKPWGNDNAFTGSMEYEQDEKSYSLTRNFSNNSTKIYDEDNNDISASFNKSKSKGLEIGLEQLGIDEETFENTTLIKQNNLEVTSLEQNNVIQKLTNIIQSGDENTSYEKAKKKIEKLLYEEVGTDKTATKPKYICRKEISDLVTRKDTLLLNKKRQENIENREKELESSFDETKKDLEECNEVLRIKQKYEDEIQQEKIKFDVEKKAKEQAKEKLEKEIKKKKIIDTVMILIAMIVLVGVFIWLKNYYLTIPVVIVALVAILINWKISYKEIIEIESTNFDVVSEDVRKKQQKALNQLAEKNIGLKYHDSKIGELKLEKEHLDRKYKDLELEKHKLQIEEESIKGDLEDLNDIVEELDLKKHELQEIEKKERIYNLAISKLDESYEELKKQVLPELQEDIKSSIYKTTNNKYSDVKYSDSQGLIFKNEVGSIEPIDKLSRGTIDQIYLGFRLAIADKYANVPFVFDEAFVSFDDERLENILKVLSDISETRQIIILSCSKREKEILDRLNIEYKDINI